MNQTASRPSHTEGTSHASALVEACWLVALAVVPILYDPHAGIAFQPVKMAVLRALGILAAAGLLCHFAPRWSELRSRISLPLVAAALLLLSSIVSSILSIVPHSSWLGFGQFHQGTVSLACVLSLFAGVALLLRTRGQFERLVSAALAGSIPVVLYALVQAAGLDPLAFDATIIGVPSLPGYPLYLGGYLVMVLPLCAWRVFSEKSSRRAIPYVLLLILQVVALFACQKRASFLALVIGLAAAGILVAVLKNKPRVIHSVGIFLAGTAVVLIVLAGFRKAGVIDDSVPVLGRLAATVPVGGDTGDVFRSTLWKELPPLLQAKESFEFPDRTRDDHHHLRPFVGFGPETLAAVLPQHWSLLQISPLLSTESRFHNAVWDILYAQGFLGLAALLLFLISTFLSIYSRLGLIGGPRAGLFFSAWTLLCAALSGTVLGMIFSGGFAGLGIQAGLLVGVLTFPLLPRRLPVHDKTDLAAIFLLCALVAHLVDLSFSFASASTLGFFWILAGAAVASPGKNEPASVDRAFSPAAFSGVLSGLILVALFHGFVDLRSAESVSALDVLWHGPLLSGGSGPWVFLFVVLPAWLGATLLLCGGQRKSWLRALAVSVAIGCAYAVLKSCWIASAGAVGLPLASIPVQVRAFEFLGVSLLGVVILAVLAIACTLGRGIVAKRELPILLVALVPALFAIWWSSAGVLRAEAASGWGRTLAASRLFPQAAVAYERAVQLDPADPAVRITLAETLLDADPSRGIDAAIPILDTNPREPSRIHDMLGTLLLRRAVIAENATDRSAFAARAEAALNRAAIFEPGEEVVWLRRAFIARAILGDKTSAERFRLAAEAASAKYDPGAWAAFYMNLSLASPEQPLREMYAERSLGYLDRFLDLELPPDTRYESLLNKALLHRAFGNQNKEAYETLVEAVKFGEAPWGARVILSEMAAEAGNRREAEAQIDLAIKDAPMEAIPRLQRFRQSLSSLRE